MFQGNNQSGLGSRLSAHRSTFDADSVDVTADRNDLSRLIGSRHNSPESAC
jgi:hypothetical protein